jgi:hypothetical protein
MLLVLLLLFEKEKAGEEKSAELVQESASDEGAKVPIAKLDVQEGKEQCECCWDTG